MKKVFVLGILIFICLFTYGQIMEIGSWRDHLPSRFVIDIYKTDDDIICVTEFNVFKYNLITKESKLMSRSNYLSDVNISSSDYKNQKLIISYDNCNIDIIQENVVYNVPDVKNSQILGEKKINEIKIYNNTAYLASSFGIIELDLIGLEIKNTFKIDDTYNDVEDVVILSENIFASSSNGLYMASINNSNLSDYNSWQRISDKNFKKMTVKDNNIYIQTKFEQKDSIYVLSGNNFLKINSEFEEIQNIVYTGNKIYVLDKHDIYRADSMSSSLFWPNTDKIIDLIITENIFFGSKKDGLITFINNIKDTVYVNGPFTNNVFDMSYLNDKIYVAPGGVNNAWGNIDNRDGLFIYDGFSWENISYYDILESQDVLQICPYGAEGNYFVGSWNNGVIEQKNQTFIKHDFDNTNGALDTISVVNVNNWSRIRGLIFDQNNNLWITNSQVENPLVVKKPNGWDSFTFPGLNSSLYNFGQLLIDDSGQKWILLPKGEGVLVFNDNNTIDQKNDDSYKIINTNYNNGNLSSMDVYSIAKDRNGAIWIGTNDGISIFYSPELVFSGFNYDAQKILIEQDGYYEYLLDGQTVSSICVDNANRKWIGTLNNGVFLYDDDENIIVENFNTQNSPLLSNTILDICINENSGEVFFGTNNGICSFRGLAVKNFDSEESIFVYPNPVKKENSYICVSGLENKMNVKFSTISGKLKHQTISRGGQAIWNFDNRPEPGVYLIFATDDFGFVKKIGKFLISE